ncbi:hypothetical protein BBW65_06025 [Helicobacter enhydrae]|uniref:Lipopolysaccharide heptosyltransferase family protein n=1 Tax=Helicobacter enhydrae TaxID=222136 RepID=A0A1B1U6I8_9HELI|nr:hypothetical protein [Helicobacter enhydrae]ANV98379.1 hypothetical protein BBW65_06025 [Helicobacter enhydrae]
MRVGFIYFHALGDNVMMFDALLALKKIYDCELIVFGNALFAHLLEYCDFVDEVVDIRNDIQAHLDVIDGYHLDYVVLPKCKREYLIPLKRSNVGCIIAPLKLSNILTPRCKTPSILSFLRHRAMSMREKALWLCRVINPKKFDTQIGCVDWQEAQIRTSPAHQTRTTEFLNKHIAPRSMCQSHLIFVCPFNVSASHTLSVLGFLKLIEAIGQIKNCIPFVVTYPQVHQHFVASVEEFERKGGNLQSLIVYQNNDDVLNLIECVARSQCLIAPSTGPIHIASNLSIPTIGLFAQDHLREWATKDRRYVILPKPLASMTSEEECAIIEQTLEVFEGLLHSGGIGGF